MKIASWNVNSIKARQTHVQSWLKDHAPDYLLLQELKGLEFPSDDFLTQGYHVQCVTQKAYNGVAILSKEKTTLIRDNLPGDNTDEQARYLEVQAGDLRLINIYLPNGNPIGTEKFDYKLAWMDRLYDHLAALRAERAPFLIGGDFNIIPQDEDCHSPAAWADDALFQPQSRAKFRALLHLGLTDAFRLYHKGGGHYTFWDYQAGAWPQNKGIRIDHFLCSPAVTDCLKSCWIDKAPRGMDKASDHTPILVELD